MGLDDTLKNQLRAQLRDVKPKLVQEFDELTQEDVDEAGDLPGQVTGVMTMPKKGDVHVVPSDKGWRVEIEGTGGARSTHETQAEHQDRTSHRPAEQDRTTDSWQERACTRPQYVRARPASDQGLTRAEPTDAAPGGAASSARPRAPPARKLCAYSAAFGSSECASLSEPSFASS